MAKSHLPISSYARLNQLRRLKQLYEGTVPADAKGAKELTDAQKAMAGQVLGSRSLDVLRYQAISEMVASGYLDEEIKMMLADPDAPYSILIEGLKPDRLAETIRAILRKVKKDQAEGGSEQARDHYVQQQLRLIDATWVTLEEAGAAHHKSLLEFIDERTRAVAEARGGVFKRAGRTSPKQPAPEEQPEPEEEESADKQDPNWEEEYKVDASENPE